MSGGFRPRRAQRTRFDRRRFLQRSALGGSALAATALIACGGDGDASGASGAAGADPASGASGSAQAGGKSGSVSYGTSTLATTLSPNSSALWATEYYAIYDQLARVEANGDVQPSLATSWETPAPDRWVFNLREAEWSDGQPFTAEDVKFTFDYVSDAANKSAMIARVNTIASVEVIDPRTVAINTKGPDPILPRRLFLVHILPQHYLGDPANGDAALGTKPVGTGAYIVESYSQGGRLQLKKNPRSWRGTKGIDAVDIRVIAEPVTRMAAYQTNEIDIADGVPLNEFERIKALRNTEIFRTPGFGYHGFDVEYFDPPYNDKRVRLALAHAIDYQAIQKALYFGVPKVMQGQMLSEATFGFNPALKAYAYDPDTSKRLLREAGVANGFRTRIEYVGANPDQKRLSEAVADYFKEIGIESELVPIEINVWRDGLYGRRKRAPLMFDSWASSAALEASIALQWMLSDNAGKFYNNKDFDAAYHAAVTEPDDEKRKQYYAQATQIMHDDPPGLWVVEASQIVAYRKDKIADFQVLGAPPLYFDQVVPA